MNNISVSKDEQGIVLATLDMPGRHFNVFSEDMMTDLSALIESIRSALSSSEPPKGLVITSGKSSFAAGADLAMIQDFGAMRYRASWQEMRERYSYLGRLFRRLEKLPLPVVAAINGLALGGGLELAMSCHRRVCADAPHVQLGLPEVLLGLLPGAGGTQRLPRYVGLELGTRMLLSGRPLTPSQALNSGLIDEVVAPGELLERAKAIVLDVEPGAAWDTPGYQSSAEELAKLESDFDSWSRSLVGMNKTEASLYPAIAAIQKCVHDGFGKPFDEACDLEWDVFVDLMSNPVSSNMVTTGFLSKTAATKRSQTQLPLVAVPESYSLADGLDFGTKPFRKVSQLPFGEADYDIVRADQAASVGDMAVVNLSNGPVSPVVKPCLRLVGEFNTAEVIELARGDVPRLTAEALALLSTSGKAVVLSHSNESVNSVLLEGVREAFESSGMSASQFLDMGTAVGLDTLIGRALPEAGPSPSAIQDRRSGYELLLSLCERVYHWIVPQLAGDGDEVLLAGVDLLAVYGAGFPKWSGGPLSCLTMFQRGEVDCPAAQRTMRAIEWTFKDELGYRAAKNSSDKPGKGCAGVSAMDTGRN